jgi:hypothetical protein
MSYDITHCWGGNCPLQDTCLRCTAVIGGRQDFFGSSPFNKITGDCEHYWDDRPSEEKISQLAYQLWQQSGCQHGNAVTHWLVARKQLIENVRNS